MKYRKLGDTGLEVSEIGFGAWGIGGLTKGATSYGPTNDDESRLALETAFDAGITFYDTSDIYGNGHSEELLGEVFKNVRSNVIIASKVGFLEPSGRQDFSPGYIRKSLEATLRRLQSDYLDLYQLHSPSIEDLDDGEEIKQVLSDLRQEGKIRAFGVSSRSPSEAINAISDHEYHSIQVNFNLIDQRAIEVGLFDLSTREESGVIGRTPLCFGFLSGSYQPGVKFDDRDHRSSWSSKQIELWANAYHRFSDVLTNSQGQTPSQNALRFCLSYPAVSTTIPGMMTKAEVLENAAASELDQLSQLELGRVREAYENSVFFAKN